MNRMQKIKIIIIALFLGTILIGQENEKIIEKWDNGVVRTRHYYKGTGFDEVLIGVKKYYENGDLRIKARFSKNVLHGEYSYYLEGNNLLIKGNFNNGDYLDGDWSCYFPESILAFNPDYSSRVPSCTIEVPELDVTYRVSSSFYKNGELKNYRIMKFDVINPKGSLYDNEFTWYDNGILERLDKYESYNGRHKGWVGRWRSGKIKKTRENYESGAWESFNYRENGVIESSIFFTGKEMMFEHFDKSGKIISSSIR